MSAAVAAGKRVTDAWCVLASVLDPEVPALSVVELGIVREVGEGDDGAIEIVLTPTYSGCPATEAIEADIRAAMQSEGLGPVRIAYRLSPPWTTDWIGADAKRKLAAYGIAPPGEAVVHVLARNVPCPRCESARTERLSVFGSTACKSLYRCLACREPFEYFKPI